MLSFSNFTGNLFLSLHCMMSSTFLQVKLEQGLKMIKIFEDHVSKTCLLDDFEFYENREKAIQEKKAKHQQYQKQVKCASCIACSSFVLIWIHHLSNVALSLIFSL